MESFCTTRPSTSLLLKLPQNKLAGKQINSRVRLLDIAPTVLEAVAVPVPSQMQGQSLLRLTQGGSQADALAYARGDFSHQGFGWSPLESWRAGKYVDIRAPKPELYDFSPDPAQPIISHKARRLRSKL